jgi:hypothetical protein
VEQLLDKSFEQKSKTETEKYLEFFEEKYF